MPKLTKENERRLKQMNKHLHPAKLRYRTDTGRYFFAYRRKGRSTRKVLGEDIDWCYERALQLRRELKDEPPPKTDRKLTLGDFYDSWSKEKFKKSQSSHR